VRILKLRHSLPNVKVSEFYSEIKHFLLTHYYVSYYVAIILRCLQSCDSLYYWGRPNWWQLFAL